MKSESKDVQDLQRLIKSLPQSKIDEKAEKISEIEIKIGETEGTEFLFKVKKILAKVMRKNLSRAEKDEIEELADGTFHCFETSLLDDSLAIQAERLRVEKALSDNEVLEATQQRIENIQNELNLLRKLDELGVFSIKRTGMAGRAFEIKTRIKELEEKLEKASPKQEE